MAKGTFDYLVFNAQKKVTRALSKQLEDVSRGMRKGARRAISRTLTTAQKETSKVVREELVLKAGDVKERIDKEILDSFEGRLVVRDRRIELAKFGRPAMVKGRGARKGGVTVKVYRKKGRMFIPEAFIAKGTRSGRFHVLKREGRDRFPIYIKYGPSLATVANKHLAKIVAKTEPVFAKNLEREINFYLSKL